MRMTQQQHYFNQWQDHIDDDACSLHVREWLMDSSSLTQRLNLLSHDQIEHQLLSADMGGLLIEEVQYLNLPDQHAWLRTVVWFYQSCPWVFARCVVPYSSLSAFTTLQNYGEHSLGHLLFQKEADMQREPLQFNVLNAESSLYKAMMHELVVTPEKVYARRSKFSFQQQPLLITEVFLPDFWNFLSSHECRH